MNWLLVNSSVPRDKLSLGIPFYGNSFDLKDPSDAHLGSAAYGPGEPGALTNMDGSMAYYEVSLCNRPLATHPCDCMTDELSRSASAYTHKKPPP